MSSLPRPIFIVAPPQSGSTYLFEALAGAPETVPLAREGRRALDLDEQVRPARRGYDSNRRAAEDATPEIAERIRTAIAASLPNATAGRRLVDATPRNALRIPFLDAIFPDASFVYLYREPRDTVLAMAAAWESGEFVTYPRLPDWPGPPWSLLLVPGWRELAGAPVPEIAMRQWETSTRIMLDDLAELPPERWCVSDFAALRADPEAELERLCGFLGLSAPAELPAENPDDFVLETARIPSTHLAEPLQALLPGARGLAERAHELIASPVSKRPTATPDADSPVRSVYTGGFVGVLERLGGSLLLSAPNHDRLICVRRDGPRVNTHFRGVRGPAGIATRDGRIVVAARGEVRRYEALGDSVFVPTESLYIGDAGVRDVALVGGETWLAASRLSALMSPDRSSRLVPRWTPPFVTEVREDDRCHLVGLAVADGEVRFVTALGVSDEPEGWRERRLDGGCVIDVATGEVIADGLCLPHSPRLHDGRLWFLEAGEGALCELDPASGEKRTVIELPGFARGLALGAGLAFVGLSRLRDSEAGALPVEARFDELFCGVVIVDLESGAQLGFLRFEERIDEIGAVALLAAHEHPEIADPASEVALGAVRIAEPRDG